MLAIGSVPLRALDVQPAQINFQAVSIGPLGKKAAVTINTTKEWTLFPDPKVEWLAVAHTNATTATASLVDWGVASLKPGTYTTTVAVKTADGDTANIQATLVVAAPTPPPVFSYLSGPVGCTQTDGYPDAATCVVPDEKPPGGFVPPQPGGSYIDPTFGARVRVLTAPFSTHGYAGPSPLSANNSYALLQTTAGFSVVEVATGKIVAPMPTTMEGTFWDPVDEESFYYVAGSSIIKFNWRTQKPATVIDYSKAPYNFSVVKNGFRNDASRDNWIGIFAPNQSTVCAADLIAAKSYCSKYDASVVGMALDASNAGVMMAKGIDRASGKRYIILNTYPTFAIFSVNTSGNKLDFESLGPEVLDWGGNGDGICDPGERCMRGDHFDTFEDSTGNQWMMGALETPVPCEFSLISMSLSKPKLMGIPIELNGGRKRIMPLFQCGGVDTWTDEHIGCSKTTPYCVVSTTYTDFNGQFKADLATPIKHTAHMGEVMVIRDNGKEVRRLMEHRSVPLQGEDASSYWTTPRAAISNDANYVVVDSNFGQLSQNRVVLVETGYGKAKIAAQGLVNAASLTPAVSPGGLATIFGVNLANCRAGADAFPLPDELCGVRVSAGGMNAKILYASPEQINVQLPRALRPASAVTATVTRSAPTSDTDSIQIDAAKLASANPAIFSYALDDGVRRSVVQNSDGTLNGPVQGTAGIRPLKLGEIGVIWANSMGPTNPVVEDGQPAPGDLLARVVAPVSVVINGVPQRVLFAGLAPSLAGVYQVNFQLDTSTPILEADGNRISIAVGGVSSNSLPITLAAAQ